jgi:hypothetical protein
MGQLDGLRNPDDLRRSWHWKKLRSTDGHILELCACGGVPNFLCCTSYSQAFISVSN